MTMSARELQRIEVLTEVLAGRRDVASGAAVRALSVRQMHRLGMRYREDGGGALVHKERGRSFNNQLNVGLREYAMEPFGYAHLRIHQNRQSGNGRNALIRAHKELQQSALCRCA